MTRLTCTARGSPCARAAMLLFNTTRAHTVSWCLLCARARSGKAKGAPAHSRFTQSWCVRNHTQTHIHIHTSTSHTKAGFRAV